MTVAQPAKTRLPVGAGEVLVVTLVAGLLWREQLSGVFDAPRCQTWATIFVSVCVQALPFLVLGVALSGLIAALVPPGAINRWLPKQPALAVPAAGVAGMGLPGCECGSVPIAGRLVASGAHALSALTFLLAAPAVNPVVLVATAVAFPGRPEIVGARFLASMATAVVVGWIWIRIGEERFVERARQRVSVGGTRFEVFRATALHDMPPGDLADLRCRPWSGGSPAPGSPRPSPSDLPSVASDLGHHRLDAALVDRPDARADKVRRTQRRSEGSQKRWMCTLVSKRRRVRRWEWLMVLPKAGLVPGDPHAHRAARWHGGGAISVLHLRGRPSHQVAAAPDRAPPRRGPRPRRHDGA